MKRLLTMARGLWRLAWGNCPKCGGLTMEYCWVCEHESGRVAMWRKFKFVWK